MKKVLIKYFCRLVALGDRLWRRYSVLIKRAKARNLTSKSVFFDAGFGRFLLDLTSYEDRFLFIHGGLEPYLYPLFASFIRGDSLVIDVGANCGIHSIFFRDLMHRSNTESGLVLAIEPHPRLYARLLTNIRLNGAEGHIHAHNLACMDTEENRILFSVKEGCSQQGNHSLLKNEKIEGALKDSIEQLSVITRRLDQIVSEGDYGLPVTFIKIDVEGAEHAVLKGASNIIREYKPTILLEFRCDRLRHLGVKALDFKELADCAYYFYAIEKDGSVSPVLDLQQHIDNLRSTSTEVLATPFELIPVSKANSVY